ncbi:MAG: prepilin-type N-terminal cleavage/methylation domain-containing protein [Burkholderiales bacterium]|nr:prepilin-type N-terminal cleavage/methylation domain-containing protein [Burkholderiales bacterium]
MSRLGARGFTLIELMVVLAIVGLLVAIAAPRYFGSLERSKEVTLRQDLATLRDAIDKYHADLGVYPDTLEALVEKRYLRGIPADPITDSVETWRVIAPPEPEKGKVYDVKSGAAGQARDGTQYGDW